MEHLNKKIAGATLAGLFAGILIGYILGVNKNAGDDKLLSEWTKDCGNYEDGNVFGYETGLPENYHDKPGKKILKAEQQSLK